MLPQSLAGESIGYRHAAALGCHRRIITDYLLVDGIAVTHILAPGKIEKGTVTPAAQPQSYRTIRYTDADQPELPLQ